MQKLDDRNGCLNWSKVRSKDSYRWENPVFVLDLTNAIFSESLGHLRFLRSLSDLYLRHPRSNAFSLFTRAVEPTRVMVPGCRSSFPKPCCIVKA
jgi:hypothetical protein